MSRHTLSDIILNLNDILAASRKSGNALIDHKGNTLEDWASLGILGWDDPLNTYFINIDTGNNETSLMLGTDFYEIPAFETLCEKINSLFNTTENTFVFEDNILISEPISNNPVSKESVKHTESGALQVDYYHQYDNYSGNIIWPRILGQSESTHPVISIKTTENSPIVRFRNLGYFASCFPEGDGITLMDNSKEKSPEQVMEDIRDCFGWEPILKNEDKLV